jgi:hypothetical protein
MPSADFDYKFSFRIEGEQEVVASFQAITGLLDGVKTKAVEVRDTTTDSFGRLVKASSRSEDAVKGMSDAIRTQHQAIRNLKTQNDAIIEQARRRGALTKTEETILRANTAQMDKYADSILVATARMDKSSPSYVEANLLFRDVQRYGRAAEQTIEQLSDEAVNASYAQELFNDAMKAFKSDGQIVVNEMRILAREMDGGKISVQAGTQVWEIYQQQLQEIIAELRNFINTQDLSADEMAQATSVLANLSDAADNATRGFAGTRGTMLGMNKVASGANQIMLSFGDIIQDSAQFSFGFAQGARAIGNNIAFAAEQFVLLQANMRAAQGQAVTFGATMKALGGALAGPVGVVVLINTLVTAVTVLPQLMRDSAKGADEMADSLKSLFEEAANVSDKFEDPFNYRKNEIIYQLLKSAYNDIYVSADAIAKAQGEILERDLSQGKVLHSVKDLAIALLAVEENATKSERAIQNIGNAIAGALPAFLASAGPVGIIGSALLGLALGSEKGEAMLRRLALSVGIFGEEARMNSIAAEELKTEFEKLALQQEILDKIISGSDVLQKTKKRIDEAREATTGYNIESKDFNDTLNGQRFRLGQLIQARKEDQTSILSQIKSKEKLLKSEKLSDELAAGLRIELDQLNKTYYEQELAISMLVGAYDDVNERFNDFLSVSQRNYEQQQRIIMAQIGLEQMAVAGRRGNLALRNELIDAQLEAELTAIAMRSDAEIRALEDMRTREGANVELINMRINALANLQEKEEELAEIRAQNSKRQALLDQISFGADMVQQTAQAMATLGDVFNANKQFQIAMAIIDGGAAFIKALASPPGPPVTIPAALGVAARTAKVIQQMKKTDVGSSSPISATGSQSGQGVTITSTPRTSFRSVFGGQTQSPPSYQPRSPQKETPIYVSNELVADSESLYIITKRGERKVKSKQL